ncbi:peptide-N-glycosidase F-related protein [Taibaiella sp. KBW10]|uniref:peptide-N-glycosidase F-related protein n=1 Tax=Taibaiella sp. KBW10 TaxID=2153357 RepID=UPI00131557E6|nr:peptide-N-glycosidase F-related protein [Taibaiella sp. KBW10]
MKQFLLIFSLLLALGFQTQAQNTTIRVFDTVLFFDGYAGRVDSPAPQPGITRHRNDLYARKLTTQELQSIGNTLKMNVTVKAACDNYDRIGNVNVAFVPKGDTAYNPDSVRRIEIGRYITPFMNKNVSPKQVPYTYYMDNVAYLLRDASLNASYDIWIELELFGVPYAANTQVAGCAGRNDVFYGSLEFVTSGPTGAQSNNVLVPLSFKKDLNNYNANATDTLGKTTRTLTFNVPANLTDASLFLITSNHGANSGGEEYNRRNHYIYFDNNLIKTYKPGSPSCEPFRQYNTQGNGIYGSSTRTDAQWQSFSNWCPGDIIPIRVLNLGAVTAGTHTFQIRVPDAVFTGAQGYIPLSVYFQGKTSGVLALGDIATLKSSFSIYPNPANNVVTIEQKSTTAMNAIVVFDAVGKVVYRQDNMSKAKHSFSTENMSSGLYLIQIQTTQGTAVEKLQIVK